MDGQAEEESGGPRRGRGRVIAFTAAQDLLEAPILGSGATEDAGGGIFVERLHSERRGAQAVCGGVFEGCSYSDDRPPLLLFYRRRAFLWPATASSTSVNRTFMHMYSVCWAESLAIASAPTVLWVLLASCATAHSDM